MKVFELHPSDIQSAKDAIIEQIKENPVFVVTAKDELCDYIPKLELKDKIQSRIKICKEMNIRAKLILCSVKTEKSQETVYTKLSELLRAIDLKQESELVVLGDLHVTVEKALEVRYELCSIIQQFIYLNIPLQTIHVCTEKESRDNQKIRAFERAISTHKRALADGIAKVNALNGDIKNHKQTIKAKLEIIQKLLNEVQVNELKIAVAASKKSGKSVIVNSMIESEIAPTSLELATPNNCIYRKSPDQCFHLDYKGEKYSAEDAEQMRMRLAAIFHAAEKDYKNGLGIPDMNLYYPANQTGFSYYTIYDTPGPNLAGATEHGSAAYRAVDAADVIIFTIDYSKYLENDEYNYLIDIWKKMCEKEGKKYSLILNVNKLDMRYINNDDKSVIRIIDFIRNKLISTAKKQGYDLRGCIVIGTSALTYFNALTVASLKCPNEDGDCRCLLKDGGFTDQHLKKCILSYDDAEYPVKISQEYETRAISILQQLRDMLNYAEVWQKREIQSVEEMKEFSGMPNLLAYVDYIATQKARNEKINALMTKIDSEYSALMNYFHVEELIQELAKNRELLAKAIEILNDFTNDVNSVLDDNYRDLFEEYAEIYDMYEDLHSLYLFGLSKKYPIKLDEIKKIFTNKLSEQLGQDSILRVVTQQTVATQIEQEIRNEYGNDEEKKIKIDAIKKSYIDKLHKACSGAVRKQVESSLAEVTAELKREQEGIKLTLQYIWEERLSKLKGLISECSDKLKKQCAVQFNIEVPKFQIVFGKHEKVSFYTPGIIDTKTIEFALEEGMKNKATAGGFWDKIWCFFGAEKTYILLKDVLHLYSEKKLAYDLESAYKKNGNLEKYLSTKRESLQKDMDVFIKKLLEDTTKLRDNITGTTSAIKNALDETQNLRNNINVLESEKRLLDMLKQAIKVFTDEYGKVIIE